MKIKGDRVSDSKISLWIGDELKNKLDEICETNSWYRADFVRVAIAEAVATHNARLVEKEKCKKDRKKKGKKK